jgi:capsular polysaccharide biosynthesis protein
VRRPEVARLLPVRESDDPVAWLQGRLSVTRPGNTEIVVLSVRRPAPEEALILVNAVLDAYIETLHKVAPGAAVFERAQISKN